MKNTNVVFLKAEIGFSIEGLLKVLAKKLANVNNSVDAVVITMIAGAFKVLRDMDMVEETSLLGLLILARFAEKGMDVPERIHHLIVPVPMTELTPMLAPKPLPMPDLKQTLPKVTTLEVMMTTPATVAQQPKTSSARTLGGSDFASKLGVAAGKLGLGPLTEFRQSLSKISQAGASIDLPRLRELTTEVLRDQLLEPADWEVLVSVMKKNLFFSGRSESQMFVKQCPPKILLNLLIGGEENFTTLIQKIRKEETLNESSPYRVGFVIDCCTAVGSDVKDLMISCKQAINRMKQKKFIPADHWLVRKVATSTNPLLDAKYHKPAETVGNGNGHGNVSATLLTEQPINEVATAVN